jgi:hypothetical protein
MYKYICIEYADPDNLIDSIPLTFRLRNNSVVPKWTNKIIQAQKQYSIDDPKRFYGFDDHQTQITQALLRINSCIDIINSHNTIIDRKLTDVNDTDTLNYLHHIFEVYHGLLDQQTHEFYVTASTDVQRALADLNICVHRCESIAQGAVPRHVVTYYGLPKIDVLDLEDYNLFTDVYKFGTVYLNYVEIGKTLEDLAVDNDQYIADEAFRPFRHYSADFGVLFADSDFQQVCQRRDLVRDYYLSNSEFFLKRGLHSEHAYLKIGRIPLADIDSSPGDVLQLLRTRQYVKSVTIY